MASFVSFIAMLSNDSTFQTLLIDMSQRQFTRILKLLLYAAQIIELDHEKLMDTCVRVITNIIKYHVTCQKGNG